MGTRRVSVELRFHGSGHIESRAGGYSGGVVAPELADHLDFQVRPARATRTGSSTRTTARRRTRAASR